MNSHHASRTDETVVQVRAAAAFWNAWVRGSFTLGASGFRCALNVSLAISNDSKSIEHTEFETGDAHLEKVFYSGFNSVADPVCLGGSTRTNFSKIISEYLV